MFYCEKCADKKKWPHSWNKSYGKCEICETPGACNDVRSSDLPSPKKSED